MNPRFGRRKGLAKIKAEINEIKTRKGQWNEEFCWFFFFEKINKIYKTLARLIKKKRKNITL